MIINSNEIHIWKVKRNEFRNRVADMFDTLSLDERDRAHRFTFEIHKKNFICSRGLLRILIGRYLEEDPNRIEFTYSRYGKPSLKINNTSFFFNVSHSEDLSLFLFSMKEEVGIDVEKIVEIENLYSIAKHFFSPKEHSYLKGCSTDRVLELFYEIWTRKEAFVKAIGMGLSFPLREFDITSKGNKVVFTENRNNHYGYTENWTTHQIDIECGYQAAVAYLDETQKIKFFTFNSKPS